MYQRYPMVVLIVMILFVLSDAVVASQSADQAGKRERTTQIAVTGRVTDLENRPVNGARVTLYRMTYAEIISLPKIEIVEEKDTGRNGRFSLVVPHRGDSYRPDYIVARKEGFAMGWAMWQARPDHQYDIVLGTPKDLTGHVVDEAGQPIADAQVGITRAMMGRDRDWRTLELPSFLDTKTDESGHFVFANMPARATFEFRVRKRGRVTIDTLTQATFGDYSSTPNIAQTDSEDVRLQFSPGRPGITLTLPLEAKVEGIVVEKTSGKPVGGVKVIAGFDQFEEGFLPPDPVTTTEDGTFSVGGLIAGRRAVQLAMTRGEAWEWAAEPVEVELEAAETKRGIRLELTRGGIIEVFAKTTDGKPVVEASVNIGPMQRDQCFRSSTDEKGLARIRVPAGSYRVAEPIKLGYALEMKEQQVTIDESETKRVEFIMRVAPWGRTPANKGAQ